jgi:hypothetical protein
MHLNWAKGRALDVQTVLDAAGLPMILHERAKYFPFVPKRWHFVTYHKEGRSTLLVIGTK